jgi:hypothetical protein
MLLKKKKKHIIHFAAFEPTICNLQAKKFHPTNKLSTSGQCKFPTYLQMFPSLKPFCFPAIIIQGYAYDLDLSKTMGFQIYNHGCVIIRRTLKFAIVVRGITISLVVV